MKGKTKAPVKKPRMGPVIRRRLQHEKAKLEGHIAELNSEANRHRDIVTAAEASIKLAIADGERAKDEIQRLNKKRHGYTVQLGKITAKLGTNGKKK
jgi:hypothetical protein